MRGFLFRRPSRLSPRSTPLLGPRGAAVLPLVALLAAGSLEPAGPASAAPSDDQAAPVAAPASAPASAPKKKRARVEVVGPGNSVNPEDATLYTGFDECLSCHDDADLFDVRKTAHMSLFLPGREPRESGCEACHGPGEAHAVKGSKTKIRSFLSLEPVERSLACLQCHGGSEERSHYRRSAHGMSQVACDSCHEIHAPARESWSATCTGCHPETEATFGQPFRHDPAGSITCTDCHAQHGAAGRQVRLLDADEICGSCHAEQAGPFAFEHVPRLFGGCTSCHAPHGSPNPRQLMRDDVDQACLTCHVNTPEDHDQSNGIHDTCVTCHARIHGSNIDPLFRE